MRAIRRSAAVGAAVILAVALTACSGKGGGTPTTPPTSAGPASSSASAPASSSASSPATSSTSAAPAATLTILSDYVDGASATLFKSLLTEFQTKTGIKVTASTGGEDIPTIVETAKTAGQEPDIVIIPPSGQQISWPDTGVTVDVGSYIKDWGLTDRIIPDALAGWTRPSGKVMGFPYEAFQWPVWWNTKVLSSVGFSQPPQTTDQLLDLAAKLKAQGQGVAAMAIGGADWTGQKLYSQIAQSFVKPADAEKLFAEGGWCASEGGMKGIELLVQLRDAGVFIKDAEGYNADTMTSAFFAGKAAGMPAGSWSFSSAPADAIKDYVLGGFPVPAGGTYTKPTAFLGFTSNGFWVTQNGAKNIDAVKAFVQFMYDPAVLARFVAEAATPVALTGLKADALSTANPLLAASVTTLAGSVDYAVFPDLFVPAELGTPYTNDGTAVSFQPGKTAQQVCKAVDGVYGK